MQEIYRVLARLMQTDLTVMITGESGTGKELVARALHDYGKRRSGPFVAINMAAIPRDLIESELFGHEKGAFTGANTRSAGRFEQAEGGTLFLDEIGDMPMEAQTRLLRVLQQGEYTTVGGRTPIKTDVRIVAATNKDLRILIQQGLFREDLFFRLNVVPLRLPPLRERIEDVPDLIRHFFAQAEREGLPAKQLDQARARAAQALPLAGQRARAREPRAPARRALSAGDDHGGGDRRRAGAAGDASPATTSRAPRRACRPRSSAIWRAISPASATSCRRPASITASCARSSIRCCRRRSRPPAATRSAPPTCSGSTATRCARRSATSTSRSSAAAAERPAADVLIGHAVAVAPRNCRNSATLLYKSITARRRVCRAASPAVRIPRRDESGCMTNVEPGRHRRTAAGAALGRAGLATRVLGPIAVALALLSALVTFLVLADLTPIAPTHEVVVTLLLRQRASRSLLLLGIIGARGLAGRAGAPRAAAPASRLHVRIVGLFSVIAAVPAILVAVVASVTLDRGLDRCSRSSTAAADRELADRRAKPMCASTPQIVRGRHHRAWPSTSARAKPLFDQDREQFRQFLTAQAAHPRPAGGA